jgi:hypothetical protein
MTKQMVVGVVVVISAFLAVEAVVKSLRERARRISEASARACLAVSIREALTDHYRTYSVYPNTLAELPPGAIKFCDGATSDMLTTYSYKSGGTNFTLDYQSFGIHRMVGHGADITDTHISDPE